MSLLLHEPVMLREIEEILPLSPGGVYIDGTLGHAGHAKQYAKKLTPAGCIVGFDWDQEMLAVAQKELAKTEKISTFLFQKDFRKMKSSIAEIDDPSFDRSKIQGILLDLGLNLAQLEDENRGISFRFDAPLDMRMDPSSGDPTAGELLNSLDCFEIEKILRIYGDERWAKRIAEVIVDQRKTRLLSRTADLVDCVLKAIPKAMRDQRIHPATRAFQAIRIAVNHELDHLEQALIDAAELLSSGGVLAVLSYHSGEDRIIKHTFKSFNSEQFKILFKKPKTPSEDEVRNNPRSRSAKLRAIQKRDCFEP